MALFYSIRNTDTLSFLQIVKTCVVQTYGKERKWWVPDEYDDPLEDSDLLLTWEALEVTEQLPEREPDDKKNAATLSSTTTWRKILYPLKLIEFAVLFLTLAIDQLLLRFSLYLDKLWHGERTSPDENQHLLGLLNPGVWLRGIAHICLNTLYGVVQCITSPWNWVVRPITNYISENWSADYSGKGKVIIMLGLGLALAGLIVASVFTGGLLPLTFMAGWSLSTLIPAFVGTMVASMIVAQKVVTSVPEAIQDAFQAIFMGEVGYDARRTPIDDKYCSNITEETEERFLKTTFLSYLYFNSKLIEPSLNKKPDEIPVKAQPKPKVFVTRPQIHDDTASAPPPAAHDDHLRRPQPSTQVRISMQPN